MSVKFEDVVVKSQQATDEKSDMDMFSKLPMNTEIEPMTVLSDSPVSPQPKKYLKAPWRPVNNKKALASLSLKLDEISPKNSPPGTKRQNLRNISNLDVSRPCMTPKTGIILSPFFKSDNMLENLRSNLSQLKAVNRKRNMLTQKMKPKHIAIEESNIKSRLQYSYMNRAMNLTPQCGPRKDSIIEDSMAAQSTIAEVEIHMPTERSKANVFSQQRPRNGKLEANHRELRTSQKNRGIIDEVPPLPLSQLRKRGSN